MPVWLGMLRVEERIDLQEPYHEGFKEEGW